jgi:dihydroorotase
MESDIRSSACTLTLARPDVWHLHLRDDPYIASVLPDTLRYFRRAIVMPNLHPPVTTVAAAAAYRARILKHVSPAADFEPLMTLYLSDSFDATEVKAAVQSGIIHGVKLYPKGIATQGQPGVSDSKRCFPAFEAMQKHDLPLLVHGESIDPSVDIFDRERVFIDETLQQVVETFPAMRVVFEHISTREAVQYVLSAGPKVAATVTPQHMLLNRNALFTGGIRPHNYCIPVLKREEHRKAVLDAVVSGSSKFFLGTDSAPHARGTKEHSCGCPGLYTARSAMELYAMAFESAGALDKLEAFASFHGPDFYRLPRNAGTITLEKRAASVPDEIPYGTGETLVPVFAGETLPWCLMSATANRSERAGAEAEVHSI